MALANVTLTNTFDDWRTRTNQILVQGEQTFVVANGAFNKVNVVNVYATSIALSTNSYALATATSIGTSGNNYAVAIGTAGNNRAVAIGTSGNNYAVAVGTSGNNYATAIGTGANANAASASYLTSGTVPSARIGPGPYTGITGVGTLTAGTWNASIVGLLYGGTGSSLNASQGGVVYGTSAGMSITGAGVTGQVLTSAGTSAPTWTAQSSLSVGTATNQSGGTVSATTGSFSGSVTSTGGHILLTTQGAGAERHFKWNMTGRDVYFYGQDNSKQVGLFDSAAGISRWYADLSGNFGVYADITAFTSDERLKTDIRPIDDALNKISKIRGVYYRHNELALSKGFEDKDYVGVIAQEVEKVLPEVIAPAPFDSDGTGTSKSGENYKTVKYEKIVPLLIEAIKELSSQVESMKLEILELKK